MAEPFSIAASALQVAGAGLKLVETLKSYTDSVRKAEKQLKPIADHVKLTSDVLTNVGSLLKNDEIRSLYTKELLGSTSNALGGCRTAFEDLDKFISKLLKPNEVGKVSIQTTARFTFYFKQKELDILQAHLERFKSSLDLVLGVLNLASSAKSAKEASVIASMKVDIQRLIQAEHDAKKKEASLVTPNENEDSSRDLTDTKLSRNAPSSTQERPSFPAMNAAVITGSATRGLDADHTEPSVVTQSGSSGSIPEDLVLECLSQCADAARRLTADIEEALSMRNKSGDYKHQCLIPAYQNVLHAMENLTNYENRDFREMYDPPPYAEGGRFLPAPRPATQWSPRSRENDVRFRKRTYYHDDDYEYEEYRRRRPPWPHRYRSDERRNDSDHSVFSRTRTSGSAPVPAVNVYNDIIQDSYQSRRDEPERDIAALALENQRLRSRSRGRWDITITDRGSEDEQRYWEIDRQRSIERERERIKQEYEIKALRDEVARKDADDRTIKAGAEREMGERKQIIADHEQRICDTGQERLEDEQRLSERIEQEQWEKKEKEEKEWREFLTSRRQKVEEERAREREMEERIDEELRSRLSRLGYSSAQIEALGKESHEHGFDRYLDDTDSDTRPSRQPIIIRERDRDPLPIIIREERREPQYEFILRRGTEDSTDPQYEFIERRGREGSREPQYEFIERREMEDGRELVRREESVPPHSAPVETPVPEEDYFYERRVREIGRPRSRNERSEIRPNNSASNYSRDDSFEYIRRERSFTNDAKDKRNLAEGALAGVAAAELVRHHRKSEAKETRHRSESLRNSNDQRWTTRSRSRSRSVSETVSGKSLSGLSGVAGVTGAAASAGLALKNSQKGESAIADTLSPRYRSRSRRRRASVDSYSGHEGRELSARNMLLAQPGLSSAAAGGVWERVRSKSRGRSESRDRRAVPVASAGLGGAALAGLYEKNIANKEAGKANAIEDDLQLGGSESNKQSSRPRHATDEDAPILSKTPTHTPDLSPPIQEELAKLREEHEKTSKELRQDMQEAIQEKDEERVKWIRKSPVQVALQQRRSRSRTRSYSRSRSRSRETNASARNVLAVDELLRSWTTLDI